MSEPTLVSIRQAAACGVSRLRLPRWADPLDHIELYISVRGGVGPWIKLWCPFNTECNGRDPVQTLSIQHDLEAVEWEVYKGPLPESDEYRARVQSFAGTLTR